MRILFLGSPQEVIAPLQTLLDHGRLHGHEIVGVITPPAKPFGRKLMLKDPPIAEFAKKRDINLHQTTSVNLQASLDWVRNLQIDVAITAAFGQILGQEFLSLPKRAVINIHPSLLPLYRGATPIQSALLDKATQTGVSILFTVKALDAGALILQEKTDIHPNEKAPELTQRLFAQSSEMLFPALSLLQDPCFIGTEQDPTRITHCRKIQKTDALINWNSDSSEILARFRAYSGWPGSYTFLGEKRINIIEMIPGSKNLFPSHSLNENINTPGSFFYDPQSKSLIVLTSSDPIIVKKLQTEGSQPMEANSFWNGVKNRGVAHIFADTRNSLTPSALKPGVSTYE